jgi:hypothetical protein
VTPRCDLYAQRGAPVLGGRDRPSSLAVYGWLRTGRSALFAGMGPAPGVRGRAFRHSTLPRHGPTVPVWREALTRGPHSGRRDRAEPLARPTREDASREVTKVIRRLVALGAAMALVASLSASAALGAASPRGVLTASFNTYWSGGSGASYGTWAHNAQSWSHAASTGIDLEAGAARLGLFDSVHCASNVFGIFALLADDGMDPLDATTNAKANLTDATWQMSFGPLGGTLTPLAIQRSTPKPVVDPQGFWWQGDPAWWQSVGVPVYGTLAPGKYTMHAVSSIWGGNVWDPVYTINAC